MATLAFIAAVSASDHGHRVDLDAVGDSVRAMMAADGLCEAGPDEMATREVSIFPGHSGAWHFICDDGLFAGPVEFQRILCALTLRLKSVVVGAVIHEATVNELRLCASGETISVIDADGIAPADFALWECALGRPGLAADMERACSSSCPKEHGLAAVAHALGFCASDLLWAGQLLDDDPSDGDPHLLECLRFRPVGSVPARPQASCGAELAVPRWMCARARDVSRAWRKILNQLLRGASWEEVSSGWEMVPLRVAPHMLVLNGPPFDQADDEDNVMLYPIGEVLCDVAARDHRRHRPEVYRLILDGLGSFWFALACLGANTGLLPRSGDDEAERAEAAAILRKLMPWWDQFCALEPRFYGGDWLPRGWPLWAHVPFFLCTECGMSDDAVRQMVAMTSVDASRAIAAAI